MTYTLRVLTEDGELIEETTHTKADALKAYDTAVQVNIDTEGFTPGEDDNTTVQLSDEHGHVTLETCTAVEVIRSN